MVSQWQTVGFIHGVLNTDNMSILGGLTIDYGPFQFMEHFQFKQISNYSDKSGRYCFEHQPNVCKWNLNRLAEALSPVLDTVQAQKYIKDNYDKLFENYYSQKMRGKLGLSNTEAKDS